MKVNAITKREATAILDEEQISRKKIRKIYHNPDMHIQESWMKIEPLCNKYAYPPIIIMAIGTKYAANKSNMNELCGTYDVHLDVTMDIEEACSRLELLQNSLCPYSFVAVEFPGADIRDSLTRNRQARRTPIVFLFGEERAGVDSSILKLCKKIITLPLFGPCTSYNVSVALGLLLYLISTFKFSLCEDEKSIRTQSFAPLRENPADDLGFPPLMYCSGYKNPDVNATIYDKKGKPFTDFVSEVKMNAQVRRSVNDKNCEVMIIMKIPPPFLCPRVVLVFEDLGYHEAKFAARTWSNFQHCIVHIIILYTSEESRILINRGMHDALQYIPKVQPPASKELQERNQVSVFDPRAIKLILKKDFLNPEEKKYEKYMQLNWLFVNTCPNGKLDLFRRENQSEDKIKRAELLFFTLGDHAEKGCTRPNDERVIIGNKFEMCLATAITARAINSM